MKTKITKERDQHRTTIPKKLLEESKKGKGDVVNWDVKKGKLSAEVMSHKEFMKLAKEENSLPAKTQRALAPESDEDISMYANCETSEESE